MEREREAGLEDACVPRISVPVGVRCASVHIRMCVPICCTQHTRMSCTGTCICNIVSMSIQATS